MEYRDNTLEAIYTAAGRLYFANGVGRYEYTLSDHLGNNRVTFTDLNGNGVVEEGTELLQENHYYPFGLAMKGGFKVNVGEENKYKFNSIEEVSDFGLGLYTAKYRTYDPAIGRWLQIDPEVEQFNSLTPYNSNFNNPVRFNDPDGDCPPWVCGAIAGAAVEAGAQFVVGLAQGKSITESIKSIDAADVLAAGIEGGVTAGASVVRRIGVSVVSNLAQAAINAEVSDIAEKGLKGVKVEKDGIKIVKEATVATLVGAGGEASEAGLKALKNSKATKELKKVNRELGRSFTEKAKIPRIKKQKELAKQIKINNNVAQHLGKMKLQNN